MQVGGDWYDAFAMPDGRLGIVVGDVTGRGIRAASAMGQLRTLTRAFALAEDGRRAPGEALTLLNRHQLALGDEQLFTIVYAILDPEQGTIAWANGGHPPPAPPRRRPDVPLPRGRQRADGRRGQRVRDVPAADRPERTRSCSTPTG